jgi:hypothetical protein
MLTQQLCLPHWDSLCVAGPIAAKFSHHHCSTDYLIRLRDSLVDQQASAMVRRSAGM